MLLINELFREEHSLQFLSTILSNSECHSSHAVYDVAQCFSPLGPPLTVMLSKMLPLIAHSLTTGASPDSHAV